MTCNLCNKDTEEATAKVNYQGLDFDCHASCFNDLMITVEEMKKIYDESLLSSEIFKDEWDEMLEGKL